MQKIVVVGSINMDLITITDTIAKPGETVLGKEFKTATGGKGANQAVAAAKSGAKVTMLGAVGDDVFASTCIANLKKHNVETKYIKKIDDVSTGIASITLCSGENSITVIPAANFSITPKYIDENKEVIINSDAVLVQLEVPLDVAKRAMEIAKENGVKVFFNPSPICELSKEFLELADFIVPNEHEVTMLKNVSPEKLIVTKGSAGIEFTENTIKKTTKAFDVDVKDTTGAGDTFFASFAVKISEGASIEESVIFASAAGGLSVTKIGAQSGMPFREETEKFIASFES